MAGGKGQGINAITNERKAGVQIPQLPRPFQWEGVYKTVFYAGWQQDSLYPPTVVEAAFPHLFHFPTPLPGLPGIMSLRICMPMSLSQLSFRENPN